MQNSSWRDIFSIKIMLEKKGSYQVYKPPNQKLEEKQIKPRGNQRKEIKDTRNQQNTRQRKPIKSKFIFLKI